MSSRCRAFLMGFLLLAGAVGYADAQGLPLRCSFNAGSDGWRPTIPPIEGVQSEWLRDGGRDGSGSIHIRCGVPDEKRVWVWGYTLPNLPAGRALRIRGWATGRGIAQGAAVCAQGWDAEGRNIVDFATTQTSQPLSGNFDWTQVETYLVPSRETCRATLMLFLQGTGEVWFDDIAVDAVEPGEAPAKRAGPAPGLIEMRGAYRLTGNTARATILIPLPLAYRDQVPLTYELATHPAAKLAGVRLYRDQPDNWVAEVTLEAVEGAAATQLQWRSLLLCGARSFDGMPARAPLPAEWPAEVRPWLRSTRCVQAEDPRIREAARQARGESRDVLEIIRATIERARAIRAGQKGRAPRLDAVNALDAGGSCTSNANLVAALLRAGGIPARILAGYPTWSGPLQTHYIVEAFVPGYGWYPIESTNLIAPWQPYQQLAVSIIPPEYEERSEHRRGAADGVPYLSLTEYPPSEGTVQGWGIIDPKRNCDHVATVWRAFSTRTPPAAWDAAVARARERWSKWLGSSPVPDAQHRLATPLQPEARSADDPASLVRILAEGEGR